MPGPRITVSLLVAGLALATSTPLLGAQPKSLPAFERLGDPLDFVARHAPWRPAKAWPRLLASEPPKRSRCSADFSATLLGAAETSSRPPCNPYYPLPAGATWTYREGLLGGKPRVEKLVTVRSAEGEGARRTAILEQSVRTPGTPGVAVGRARTIAHCDRGRIGLTVQGAAQGKRGDSTSSGTVKAELPGLPAADKLVAGYEWTSKSVIRATGDEGRSVTEGERESRVAGREAVTVPAGEFAKALKIVAVETLRQKGQPRSARQELVEWYVRGVGLVKRETRVSSGTNVATSVEVLAASSLLPAR